MTRDDLYKFICNADDADPANALIAIRRALAGEISYGDLYGIVVKGEDPQNRRRDADTNNLPKLSRTD